MGSPPTTMALGRPFVNASLKLPENQRFEIVGFLALLGRILWFDPRREHSSVPTANSRSRRAQGLSRLAASSRPPAGLGLDWPEHGGILDRIGAGGAHHIAGKFKPLVLSEIHAAGDRVDSVTSRSSDSPSQPASRSAMAGSSNSPRDPGCRPIRAPRPAGRSPRRRPSR
jgi:hypothetical protein